MNQLLIRIFASVLLLCSTVIVFAQQITIKGEVQDESKEPLIGASVIIKNTTTGVVTDYDGAFSLKADQNLLPLTLVVSYLGYTTQEVKVVTADERLKIVLSDNAVVIDQDIVVTGQRISEKQKAAPLTVESLDLLAMTLSFLMS